MKNLKTRSSHVKCPYCKSVKLLIISKADKRTIFSCLNCQVVSAAAEIENGKLRKSTEKYLSSADYQKKKEKWYQAYIREKDITAERLKKRLEEIQKIKKKGNLLDIGCATGIFLEIAKKRGWNVYGVETSKKIAKVAKQEFGNSRIFCGELNNARFHADYFDVVVAFDTLEHVSNLKAFLKEVHLITKKKGLFAISVPDQRGYTSKILGKSWFDYKRMEHFYFFSLETLEKLLQENGFKVVVRKKENFYKCPVKSAVEKFKRYYPGYFSNLASLLMLTTANLSGIKNIPIPLEHIYVIAEKEI